MSERPYWNEVGRSDCEYCGGTGIVRRAHDRIKYIGISELKARGYSCRECNGKGTKSVGFWAGTGDR